MLPTDHVLAFALISFVLIIVPGPNVLFVISRSLQLGRAAGVGTAVGGQIGVYAQVTAVAFGVGVRVGRSLAETLGTTVAKKTASRILWDGFLVGATNPKIAVYFAAVLPQFVDRSAGYVPLQMLLLGVIFIGIAVVSDGSWAVAAGTARAWIARSPRRLEVIGGAGGLAMIGIGVSLAVSGRK